MRVPRFRISVRRLMVAEAAVGVAIGAAVLERRSMAHRTLAESYPSLEVANRTLADRHNREWKERWARVGYERMGRYHPFELYLRRKRLAEL